MELPEGIRLLDRYSILDRIGSGGMATIYRATDERLNRVVCVKLLRTTLVEGSGSTSGRAVYQATYSHFLKEALALSKLSHGNTLRIYDFGYLSLDEARAAAPKGTDEAALEALEQRADKRDASGAPFHVSEYLDGGNLESHVRRRKVISPEEALGILEGITGAVAEAHGYGIIHRDIKPSNILFARVSDQLVPKLADFGIAHSDVKKSPQAGLGPFDGNESVSTVALFSPRWAAPEQLCGSPEGPRTDVYALGLLTTFMLGGRIFFGDEDVRKTFNDRVRGDTLVNARLAHLGFSPEVSEVLRRSMAARPEERMATAPEFYQQLREALKVRPPSSIAPFPAMPPMPTMPPPPPVPEIPPIAGYPAMPSESHEAAMADGDGSGSQGGLRVADAVAERVVPYGHRRVRFIQVHERLDLSFVDQTGAPVRMRVTMLPGGSPKLNLKGLTCFVARRGQRPTPALTVDNDGAADLVSASREVLGELTWSFGQPAQGGRLFLVDGRHLLVPYSDAQQAIALMLTRGNDLVVMCRR
ncbi:protein kinase [Labilithrix luteola]|uniref:Protein kinase n=1 Tax=Labilithrix luteola TaxID=1391654 RepID=A0A0K1Q959_9BACT|nr:protein kinase [Labilithrix luteola]